MAQLRILMPPLSILPPRSPATLERNSPVPREVELPSKGKVISIPQVGGLHHRYLRAA